VPYPCLSSAEAKKLLLLRRSGSVASPDEVTRIKDVGSDLAIDDLVRKLRVALARRRKESVSIDKGSAESRRFESCAASDVHQILPRSHPALSDPDFWTWLAVAHFSDVVEWRYGNPEKGCDQKNYGIGSRAENLLYRLWLRGELGYDPKSEDPYDLARRGDIDFWRSHVFRRRFASARQFVHAWLRFQFPSADAESRGRLTISQIRELVKHINRLKTNIVFELLDEIGSTRLIDSEWSRLAESE
jgi:Family of unknown function (DUF6339)